MADKIDTLNRRNKLKPRTYPYWQKVSTGRYIGFYRSAENGNWRARMLVGEKKQAYTKLTGDIGSDYADILKQAQKWFEQAADLENTRYTVKQCVADYIAHLKIENSEDAANRTRSQLDKHLVPAMGSLEITKLTTNRFKKWRDSLVRISYDPEDIRRSKDSANRILGMAKAALNLAFRNGLINSDMAWKRVPTFKGVGANRKLFLSEQQIIRLYEKTNSGFHNLVKAAVLTGARYGELANARVVDLDRINGSLHLDGKTGARACYLSDDALAFFKDIAKDRLPNALLLTKDNGEQWGKNHHRRLMQDAVKAAKLPRDTVFYSLRHYHISRALLAGIPAQVVAENVGTSIRMLEKHYGKFMATDRRAFFNRVAL